MIYFQMIPSNHLEMMQRMMVMATIVLMNTSLQIIMVYRILITILSIFKMMMIGSTGLMTSPLLPSVTAMTPNQMTRLSTRTKKKIQQYRILFTSRLWKIQIRNSLQFNSISIRFENCSDELELPNKHWTEKYLCFIPIPSQLCTLKIIFI